mgnify:CR=1 FL=1
MKALTVKQPWAWAIIHGGKDVENRSRPTKFRGQLYIHAGKGWADEGIDAIGISALPDSYDEFLAGMVIGTVDLIGCHPADECGSMNFRRCSSWAMGGDFFHWKLANPQSVEPFPAKGKLGIWNMEAKS